MAITLTLLFQEMLDKSLVDIAQKLPHRRILDSGTFHSNSPLEDTYVVDPDQTPPQYLLQPKESSTNVLELETHTYIKYKWLIFLIQTSNWKSRTGINGTGFCPG